MRNRRFKPEDITDLQYYALVYTGTGGWVLLCLYGIYQVWTFP